MVNVVLDIGDGKLASSSQQIFTLQCMEWSQPISVQHLDHFEFLKMDELIMAWDNHFVDWLATKSSLVQEQSDGYFLFQNLPKLSKR